MISGSPEERHTTAARFPKDYGTVKKLIKKVGRLAEHGKTQTHIAYRGSQPVREWLNNQPGKQGVVSISKEQIQEARRRILKMQQQVGKLLPHQ